MATTLYAPDGTFLRFDATTAVRVSARTAVSSHPTERLGLVSDNAQNEPLLVSIVGAVTGSPLSNQLDGGGQGSALRGLTGESRERAAVAWLLSHRRQRLSLTRDRGEDLDDLILTSIPDETDVRLRRVFSLELQQVLIAEAGTVLIPPEQPVPSAEPALSTQQDLGEQTGTSGDADPDQQSRDVGFALLGLRALGAVE